MPNNLFRYLAAALVVTATAAGCGGDDTGQAASADADDSGAPVMSIDVTAGDYAFDLAADGPVAAGFVPVHLTNGGGEPHQVIVAKLHDGVTIDELVAAQDDGAPGDADALADFAGGVNAVEPGASAEGWAELAPGSYVLLCFVPSADGVSHLHKGMTKAFEVVDAGTPLAAPADVAGTFTLADWSITLPAKGVAGSGVFAFENTGAEAHETIFLRLKEGKTLGDVAAYAQGGSQGEAPFTFAGGAGGIAPGHTSYVRLDLEPGSYLAICAVGSPKEHKAHIDLGMIAPFTVS